MNVVVHGLMTNYLKAGNGRKVIVCLHGWGDQASTFSRLIKNLGGYTFLAPDLPGFGGTPEPHKPWGVEEYANFVVAWLDKIGQRKVDAVIGHSRGGAIAIELLGAHKLEAKKLVLLAASGIRDINRFKNLFLWGGAKAAKLPLRLLPQTAQRRIKRTAYRMVGSDYSLFPELDQTYKRLISQDMQATATKIKVPTLLIYGSGDEETPVKYGQLFKEAIPKSRLEVVETADHHLHQAQSELVGQLIKDFL